MNDNQSIDFKLLKIEDPLFSYMDPRATLIEALKACWSDTEYTGEMINKAVEIYTPLESRGKKGYGNYTKEWIDFFENYINEAKKIQNYNNGIILFEENKVRRWRDILCDQGIVLNKEYPFSKYKYFSYKNGEAREFERQEDALKFSKNIEKVQINKDEIDEYVNEIRRRELMAYTVWIGALRLENSDLNDEVFSKCYSKAYEIAHSGGHDEVANEFEGIASFAREIIKAHEINNNEKSTPSEEFIENTKGKRKLR